MRYRLMVMLLLLSPLTPAVAQVSVQIGLPSVQIGFNLPSFPQLVVVPGYPVYYDPGSTLNYFFYDGMYWVYEGDHWYASAWYNGPWSMVAPYAVPVFILRVPVHYYRHPPAYFRGWHQDAPPRWGEHWGHDWERHRSGWDQWDRRGVPGPAPLPTYQRQYSASRYPAAERQHEIHSQSYRYAPHDDAVKRTYQEQYRRGGPPPAQHAEPHDSSAHPQQPTHAQQPAQSQQPTHAQQPAPAPEKGKGNQGKGGEPKSKQDSGHGKDQGQHQGEGQGKDHDK